MAITKYDYKTASEIFSEYYNLVVDPRTLSDDEIQKGRRDFMRALTRHDSKLYTDYLREEIENYRPVDDAKSKCFDFDYERKIEDLINKMENFGGVL